MRGNAWRCGAGTSLGEKLKERGRLKAHAVVFCAKLVCSSIIRCGFPSCLKALLFMSPPPSPRSHRKMRRSLFPSKRASERLRHTVSFLSVLSGTSRNCSLIPEKSPRACWSCASSCRRRAEPERRKSFEHGTHSLCNRRVAFSRRTRPWIGRSAHDRRRRREVAALRLARRRFPPNLKTLF